MFDPRSLVFGSGLALLAALLLATGCGFVAPPVKGAVALFDPEASELPFPNDLLFSGSTDGTLNIPVTSTDPADPILALNQLDGFSLTEPMTARFSAPLDPETVTPGQSVRVLQVELTRPGGVVVAPLRELVAGREFVAALADETTLAVVPLVPLQPKATYVVVVTTDLHAKDGNPVVPSRIYGIARGKSELVDSDGLSTKPNFIDDATAQKLEPLRKLVSSWDAAAVTAGILSDSIALSFAFTTQSTTEPLAAALEIARSAGASGALARALLVNATPLGPTPGNVANLYPAALQVPVFKPTGAENALTGTWVTAAGTPPTRFDPVPVPQSIESMPAIVTIPRDTPSRPVAGWPVVIFQHGITLNRTAVLTIADTLAAAGFATVAIDLPLHGFAPSNTDPLRALSPSSNAYVGPNFVNVRVAERTAGVDLVNNENEAPEPDGIVDASGTHFINLSNLITGRDNVREAVANLFFLREAIGSIDGDRDGIVDGDFDNDGAADLDGANVSFIGHSLGAIVGVTYTAFDDSLISAVLSNPGQGIAKVLVSSPTFGPTVLRGLEAAGLKPGEPNFAAFLTAAQTVLDGADPAAFARSAALRRLPILVFEAVGGGDVPSDQVIPNQIDGAPLAGTDPLIALLGPTGIGPGDALNDARGLRLVVRMSRGGHVGLIDRSDDLAVTNEMQRMVATFLASQGTALDVIDETVVSAP